MVKKTAVNKGTPAPAQAAPEAVPTEETASNTPLTTPPPETVEKDPFERHIESLQFAAKVGKMSGKNRVAIDTAMRWAEKLDFKMVFETKGETAPVELTLDERVMLAAYRTRDYHVFSCIADDLLEDEKQAQELEIARQYKPLETRNTSERDADTFYTPLEMIAMDVTNYLAKGWIPRGVMFYDDNYIQMLFGIAETILKSMIDDHAYMELGSLALWLRYREELETSSDDSEGGDDE